jgi:hypothetical protein
MRRPQLLITTAARELGIAAPAACQITGLHVGTAACPELDYVVAALQARLLRNLDHMLSQDEARGFRLIFDRMGYSGQVPAGERLAQAVLRRGLPRYNNVVDAYNVASAVHGAGIGLHDLRYVGADTDLVVSRATGFESIVPMFRCTPVGVARSDLIYGPVNDRWHPMAWLGKRDVDSDQHKITVGTTSALLVSLGNEATDEALTWRCARRS